MFHVLIQHRERKREKEREQVTMPITLNKLDPNNKTWSNDQSRFGFKMLEKMGWQTGQGLGANSQGTTEHVKIRKRRDSRGVGARPTADHWLEGTNREFQEIFKQINANKRPIEDAQSGSTAAKKVKSKTKEKKEKKKEKKEKKEEKEEENQSSVSNDKRSSSRSRSKSRSRSRKSEEQLPAEEKKEKKEKKKEKKEEKKKEEKKKQKEEKKSSRQKKEKKEEPSTSEEAAQGKSNGTTAGTVLSSRSHTSKFWNQKNMRNYSATDLAGIFGKTAPATTTTTSTTISGAEVDSTVDGVQTVQATVDMNEYFAQQLQAKRRKPAQKKR